MSAAVLGPQLARQTRLPAIVAALALHLGVLALLILSAPPAAPPIGSSTPVNIVSEAPFTDSRPAVQAPRTEAAAAPEPQPQAPSAAPAPEAGPPAPAPQVVRAARPAPAVAARPVVRPLRAEPTRAATPQPVQRAAAAPEQRAVDFSRLQQIIDSARRPRGSAASSARPGPVRAETAPQARPDAGQGLAQSELAGLQQLLERLWNPNCDVVGGSGVKLKVRFLVGLDGGVLGQPTVGVVAGGPADDPVVSAAVLRAKDAVQQASPYEQPYYGRPITVNFDAKEACARR